MDSKLNDLEKHGQDKLHDAIKQLHKAKEIYEKRLQLMGSRGEKTEVHGPVSSEPATTAAARTGTLTPVICTTTTTAYTIPQAQFNEAFALLSEAETKIRQAECLFATRDMPIATTQRFNPAVPASSSIPTKTDVTNTG